jgi:hypothetical protein
MRKEVPHHNGIDLALASSYAPACLCIVKVVTLLATHSIMSYIGVESINVFFILLAVMYIDRCMYDIYIIDSNACALCVLAAVACNVFRTENDTLLDEVPHASVIGIFWAVYALIITVGVPWSAWRLRNDVVQLIPTTLFFVLLTFTHIEHFSDLDAWCRGIAFLLVCVVWVYTLNIDELRKARGKSLLPCVLRFSPVLFIHLPVACLFFIATVVAIAWKLQKTLCSSIDGRVVEHSAPPLSASHNEGHAAAEAHIYKFDGHEIDVNAVFAMAQGAACTL